MKKYIRKADIILFIVLVIGGLAATYALSMSGSGGDTVIIKSDGKLFATYSLYEDRTIEVPAPGDSDGFNIVEIKAGKVSVTDASCSNQVCVNSSEISKSGESIVCLPNKLVVSIEGDKEGGEDYDSVTS